MGLPTDDPSSYEDCVSSTKRKFSIKFDVYLYDDLKSLVLRSKERILHITIVLND